MRRRQVARLAAAVRGGAAARRALGSAGAARRAPGGVEHALREMAAGRQTSEELTRACLAAAERSQPHTNAFVTLTPDEALEAARESDRRRAEGLEPRMLEGVPVAVKDNFCTRGVRTTAGSRMLGSFVPPYDAAVVERLRRAGAVIVGKTNMDEFSMGSGNTTSHFGAAVSPLEADAARGGRAGARVPGGSSGGSAAAVASGACLAATGSDTGGSIRLPAAYCGLAGLKPTYGLVSRHGLIAYASSFDAPSVIATGARDAHLVLRAVAGRCDRDATSRRELPEEGAVGALPDEAGGAAAPLAGVRVGVPAEFGPAELPREAREAWEAGAERLAAAGAELVPVSLPSVPASLPAYYILASAEAMSNLARFEGMEYGHSAAATDEELDAAASLQGLFAATRTQGFGPEVQRRILLGSFATSSGAYSSYVGKAQRVRRMVAREFAEALRGAAAGGVDLLLTPTATSAAPLLDDMRDALREDPVSVYLNDVMTVPANLAGVPALSVRAGVAASGDGAGLPLGLQLMSAPLNEVLLSRAGAVVEAAE